MNDYIIALMRLHIELSMPNIYWFNTLMLVCYVLTTPITIYYSVLNQNETKKMNHIKTVNNEKANDIDLKTPKHF